MEAEEIDSMDPVFLAPDRFWNETNEQGLCKDPTSKVSIRTLLMGCTKEQLCTPLTDSYAHFQH